MPSVLCNIQQPDGSFIEGYQELESIKFLSSFAKTVPMIQEMSFKCQAWNAVEDPLHAIQRFLYASTTNALICEAKRVPMKLSTVRKAIEGAYLAHIEDYAASDFPTPYSLRMRKELRSASYNWLGFMWVPRVGGVGPNPFLVQLKGFMYRR